MLDLIIKNGQCYINGKLENKDVAIKDGKISKIGEVSDCLLYTSPSPRDTAISRMPSSA